MDAELEVTGSLADDLKAKVPLAAPGPSEEFLLERISGPTLIVW